MIRLPVRIKTKLPWAEGQARQYGFQQPHLGVPSHIFGLAPLPGGSPPELRLLRAAPGPGAPCPQPERPPLIREGITLYPWQARTIPWLLERDFAHLQPWATGSGKTLTAWWYGLARGEPILWLTAAHLRYDVVSKIKGYSPGLPPGYIYVCRGHKDIAGPPPEARLVIGSWQSLDRWGESLCSWLKGAGAGATLIMDEIHMQKDHSRYKRGVQEDGTAGYTPKYNRAYWAQQVSLLAGARIGMTATPVADQISDMWAQLDLVEPGCWGSYRDFTARYCGGHDEEVVPGRWAWVAKGSNPGPEFHLRRRFTVSTVEKAEVSAHLPPIVIELVTIPIEEQNAPVGGRGWAKAAIKRGTSPMEVAISTAASMKRNWILEHAAEDLMAGQKVAIMTGRREDRASLAERAEVFADEAHAIILTGDGGDTQAKRLQIAQHFLAAPGPCLLVGTTDSFGTGYDLQDADTVYVAQLPWNYAMAAQLIGRFNRPGQTRSCVIKFLVAEGTIDARISQIMLSKLAAVVAAAPDSEATTLEAVVGRHADEDEILADMLKSF